MLMAGMLFQIAGREHCVVQLQFPKPRWFHSKVFFFKFCIEQQTCFCFICVKCRTENTAMTFLLSVGHLLLLTDKASPLSPIYRASLPRTWCSWSPTGETKLARKWRRSVTGNSFTVHCPTVDLLIAGKKTSFDDVRLTVQPVCVLAIHQECFSKPIRWKIWGLSWSRSLWPQGF